MRSTNNDVGFGLTAHQVNRLLAGFTQSFNRLWSDIRFLARRAAEESGDGSAWNHLLFAVGNFKRQTTLHAYLPQRTDMQDEQIDLATSVRALDVHGEWFDLGVNDIASWRKLDEVGGIGVPTASTTLAAIWPQSHAIVDRRTARMALALWGSRDIWVHVEPSERKLPELSWQLYGEYIEHIRSEAAALDLPLQSIERALFLLDMRIPTDLNRTWEDLAAEARRALAAL